MISIGEPNSHRRNITNAKKERGEKLIYLKYWLIIDFASFQKHTSHKNIWIIFIASKQGASNHDIEDVISGCKDNEFCNACPDNQNKETNVVKRRRYRLNILKSLLLDVPK